MHVFSTSDFRMQTESASRQSAWALWQYLHTMGGAVVTGAFVMAGVGAFYLLSGRQEEHGRLFLKVGVLVAAAASFLQMWPTGDAQGQPVTEHQPVTLAAMEGLFHSERGAANRPPRPAQHGNTAAR
jgi:cytochrome d ubiquinol oxidase subunit I